MDGQRSSVCNGLSLLLSGHRHGIKLCFVDEAQRGIVQFPQGGFGRFEARELYEVATLEKLRKTLLLFAVEGAAGLKFAEKFFGGAFGSAQLEPLLQINPQCLGNLKAKQPRIVNVREGGLQAALRANVRRDDRRLCRFRSEKLCPEQIQQVFAGDERGEDKQASPEPPTQPLDRK